MHACMHVHSTSCVSAAHNDVHTFMHVYFLLCMHMHTHTADAPRTGFAPSCERERHPTRARHLVEQGVERRVRQRRRVSELGEFVFLAARLAANAALTAVANSARL